MKINRQILAIGFTAGFSLSTAGAATITGSDNFAPTSGDKTVNFTTGGYDDWATWGDDGFSAGNGALAAFTEKAGGTAINTTLAYRSGDTIGGDSITDIGGSMGYDFTWTDGVSTGDYGSTTGTNINPFLARRKGDDTSGFSLTVAVTASPGTLTIYAGQFATQMLVKAMFSDLSATYTSTTTANPGNSDTARIFTINFDADAATDLVVSIEQVAGGNPNGQSVGISAATLTFVPEPASAFLLTIGGLAMVGRRRR